MSRSKEVAIFVSDVTSMEDQVVATAERVEELCRRENWYWSVENILTMLRQWQCDYRNHCKCPSLDSRHIGRCTLGDRQRGSCLQRLHQHTGQTQSQNNGNPVFSNLSHESKSLELFKPFAIFHKPGCQNISFQPVERWKPCKGRQKGISLSSYLSLMKNKNVFFCICSGIIGHVVWLCV